MANYSKLKVIWRNNLNDIYKENTIIGVGQEAVINMDENGISNIYVNFKVNNDFFTDLVEINGKVIQVPFKTDVLKVGTHQLEIVAYLKNGDVVPSPTFSYYVEKSLGNTNAIEADTYYPILIELLEQVEEWNERIPYQEEQRIANENERKSNEINRQSNENIRISNENTRQSNESNRQQYETQRRVKEDERLTDEQVRVNAENIRIANENERLRKEIERQNAEELRQIAYNSSLYGRMDEAEDRLDAVDSQLAYIEVNVKDFGAKGDDLTDDTQSFIDAINKAETTTKHIKIPSGIYQIQGVNIPSNFTITLEKDATIKLRSGYLNPIFTINNNTTINNGYFDGNRNSQNGAYVEEGAIHVIGDYNVFNNIELFNARAEGLLIKGNNNIVNGGVFRNNENGSGIAIGNSIIDAVHNKVYKAHCHSCQGSNFSINGRYTLLDGVKSTNSLKNNAITLGHPNSPADYSIIQNSLIDGGLEGIGGQAGTCNVVIRNNTIMNMTGDNGAGIIITDLANSFRIEGNLIKNCKNGIVLRYPNNIITNNIITENNIYGVRVELESINNTFSNNLIQLNKNNGIQLTTPSNIIVNNNILNNSQGSSQSMGIYMTSSSKFNIIEGNNISDTQTTKTQYRGIYCEGTFNTIKDNVCLYNTNKGIITVSNNYLKNNRQSDVDDLVIEVDLSTTAYTTTVSNYNISPTSILQLELISQSAIKNNARITSQTNGSCVITCDSLEGGKVKLII